jgi:hypothetical protein
MDYSQAPKNLFEVAQSGAGKYVMGEEPTPGEVTKKWQQGHRFTPGQNPKEVE